MAFLIGGANSAADTGYDIANSCRFNDDDSPYMHFTPGAAGNRKTMTFSFWFKKGQHTASNTAFFGQYNSANENNSLIQIDGSDQLAIWDYSASAYRMNLRTTKLFRDHSAWYHICIAIDTTQGTDTDKVKIYVNGTQQTSFATAVYPSLNLDLNINVDKAQQIGVQRFASTSVYHWDGYLAEFFFIDGTALAPTAFGEFNEDSPTIWQPIDCKDDLTFGTNGYYLDFEDSDNLGDDESGNTNDFTESGITAADQATDSRTNNFCTMNPLVGSTAHTFSEGNCKIVSSGSDTRGGGVGTFGLTAGKWYWEVKLGSLIANHTHGVVSELTTELYAAGGATSLNLDTGATTWRNDDGGEVVIDGTVTTADYGIMAEDSIMGIALDMDNHNISYYDDGSALVTDLNISTTRGVIFPLMSSGISCTAEVNFGGCSSFAVSSAANDANGHGVFEHAPPSGYLALCSKNLGSTGG